MKKLILGLTATAVLTFGIIAFTGCEKSRDASTETTSREELVRQAQGMLSPENLNLLDLNWVDTSSYTAEELEQFFESYMTLFISRAYLVFYTNEDNPMLTDVLLIPIKADFAETIFNCFTESGNNTMLIGFKTKDKKRFNDWVTQKTEEGYIVVTKYDKKTKEYEAAAFTKLEWTLITSKP